jgi:hypothetical protein
MIAEVRGRLAINKQISQQFDVGRFSLKKLSELELTTQYQTEI